MPLVTMTCSNEYYPPDVVDAFVASPQAQAVLELSLNLPKLILMHADKLRLEDGTPEEAVQVDIRKFHAHSVNSVDLWIHVWFSESWNNETVRHEVRDALISLFHDWFDEHELKLSWALDIAMGPTHGCIANASGEITQRW